MPDLEFIRRSPGIAPASGDLRRSGVRSRWSEAPFPRAMARMTVVQQTPSKNNITLCTGWILKNELFITLCTGWILKKRAIYHTLYRMDPQKRAIYCTLYRMGPQNTGYLSHFVQDGSSRTSYVSRVVQNGS